MLSICIPIYNQVVSELTHDLHRQAETLGVEAEILLLDDASDEKYRKANRSLSELPLVRYVELNRNTGRSRIRNSLAQMARYPLLLYIDCDMAMVRHDYLQGYLEAAKDGSIVCGGHVYQEQRPEPPFLLHWYAGSIRETKDWHTRQINPCHSFMTANFLVPATIIYQLPFNEELNGYGHEDTLYGFQLKKRGFAVKHIDNPVAHTGLETSEIFLKKTADSLNNLFRVYALTGFDKEFREMVRVLKTYETIKKMKLCPLFAFLHGMVGQFIVRHLKGRKPRLWMFDLYKLGIICSGNFMK